MAMHRNAAGSRSQSPWVGWIKFLFILAIAAMMFFLAQSMVRHHFFSGSRFIHQSDSDQP